MVQGFPPRRHQIAKSTATASTTPRVECVSKWHYRPAIKDTQAIDTQVTVKVDWSLKDAEGDGEKSTQSKQETNAD
jgi:hypothetical protein